VAGLLLGGVGTMMKSNYIPSGTRNLAPLGESMRQLLFGILVFSLSAIAHAEIEKLATTCETAICFHWWPKLPAIDGWHQDQDQSFNIGANAQAPNGFTFSNAETVIYAKAIYKPRAPKLTSLQSLIDSDISEFKSEDKTIEVKDSTPISTGDGASLKSFTFFPAKQGNWEQVTYGEENDFYLIFTISSRSKQGFDKSFNDYKKFINDYKISP
jgi:hypothetical protein